MFGKKKTVDELWNEHRDEFLKIYSREQVKPLTHSNLEKAFIDKNLKQIYRFGKDVALPLERFGKMNEYMTFMSKGLTAEEDTEMDLAIEKILESGIGKSQKNVSGIGAILQERKKRRKLVIHTELLYNFIAVQLVREDERPEVFDNDIHKEKIITFKEMVEEQGAYFFFQKRELNRLSALSSMSQKEWETYWEESLIQQKVLPQALKVYSSQTT